jgi:hypothetical protein
LAVDVSNALGDLIEAEVERAEADMTAARNRGQAVLTASGALVTLLAGVLALAVGKDAKVTVTGLMAGATVAALLAFIGATIFVLIMYLPVQVQAVSDADVANYAKESWEDEGWDQQVSIVLATYLQSMRKANKRLVNLLTCAITAEVIGIASAAVMALSLLGQAA